MHVYVCIDIMQYAIRLIILLGLQLCIRLLHTRLFYYYLMWIYDVSHINVIQERYLVYRVRMFISV
jgi:hypothetical protein